MTGRSGSGSSFGTSDRLHRPSEYSKAMASRTRYSDSCFELRFFVAQSADGSDIRPRLGLIVPKKFAKHAVLRNLLKRVARESFRTSRAVLPAGDIVLRLKSPPLMSEQGLDRATRLAWRQSVDRLFKRIAK